MTQHTDPTDDNIQMIVDRRNKQLAEQSVVEKAISKIAKFSGTVTFAVINLVFFIAWIGFNMTPLKFDEFPFILLTLAVSLESIFLTIFLLIVQYRSDEQSEDRHHLDLQINLLAEKETTEMMKLLNLVAEKVGISEDDRRKVIELEQDTDAGMVLDKIEQSKQK